MIAGSEYYLTGMRSAGHHDPRDPLDVSDRLDRLGLTHLSGLRTMREQLLTPEHHADLHASSDLLRPVPSSERKASRTYTTSTALNRLVDATAPESWVVRRFERLQSAFCADPSDPSIRSQLSTVLSDWKAVGDRLQPAMATDDTLSEAAPLAAALSFAAHVGLDGPRRAERVSDGIP